MKKSIKILTLVLSLALICGALIVAAFAEGETEITGITIYGAADFEDAKSFTYTPGTAKNFALDQDGKKAVSLDYKKSGGDVVLEKNEIDGNTYFYMDWGKKYEAASGSDAPYLQTYGGNGWVNVPSADKGELLTEMKYYIFDFDISFSAPQQFTSGTIQHSVYYSSCAADAEKPTASGSGTAYNNFNTFKLSLSNNNNVVTLSINGESEKAVVGANGSWSHVTWILEPYIVTDANGKNFAAKMYLVVDGVVIDVVDHVNNLDSSKFTGGDRTLFYSRDTRINAVGSPAVGSACFDNVALRSFDSTYNGNLSTVLSGGVGTNLSAWESNLYDAENMPAGMAVAMLGEGETATYYDDLQKAIDAANAGDTITLCGNVTSTVTINKPLTINCGDYTFATPKIEGGYVNTYNEADKTWTYVDPQGVYCMTYTSGSDIVGMTDNTAFATAIANVSAGGTITFYGNVTYTDNKDTIELKKSVTINLNGYELAFNQTAKDKGIIRINANNIEFVIKNGTINHSRLNSDTVVNPFLRMDNYDKATVKFTNITMNGGCIVYNMNSVGAVIEITGGTYNLTKNGDGNGNVAIESRNSATINVSGATFNLGSSHKGLVSSLHYKQLASNRAQANYDSEGKFTGWSKFDTTINFSNCKINCADASKNIILNSNEHTKISLDNCELVGALNPTRNSWDTSETRYHFVLGSTAAKVGKGCVCAYAKTSNTDTTCKNCKNAQDACICKFTDENEDEFCDLCSKTETLCWVIGAPKAGDVTVTEGTTLTAKTISSAVVFSGDYVVCNVAANATTYTVNGDYSNAWYKIVQGGKIYYYIYPAGTTNTLKTIIGYADKNTEVTLLRDIVYTPTSSTGGISVDKDLTLNLNGHLLDMLTAYKGTYINIGAGKSFTILGEEKGSKLVCAYSKDANAGGGTLFASADAATITLKGKGLVVSCAALYGKWGDVSVTINVEDCYFDHCGAFENGANVYISNKDGTKVKFTINIKNAIVNGLTTGVYNTGSTLVNEINIENSVILSSLFAGETSYNAKTVVNVKGNSYIATSLSGAKAVNVTGDNNYFTTNDWITKANGISLVEGNVVVSHYSCTHPWVVSAKDAAWDKVATLAFAEGTVQQTYKYYAGTNTIQINWGACTCGDTACDNTHIAASTTTGILGATYASTYANASWQLNLGATKYTLTGWKNSATGELFDVNAVITADMCDNGSISLVPEIETGHYDAYTTNASGVIVGNHIFSETFTFLNLTSSAPNGATVTLTKDCTWTGTKDGSNAIDWVQQNLTIDLNGFTLTVQQTKTKDNKYITNFLDLQNGTLTVKNGTIRTYVIDAEGNDTGVSYPFIRITNSGVYKSITLNVENVNTYGGTFIYNMTAFNATINVTGGEHYLTNKYADLNGTFIEARANVNVTITGAKFYVSANSNGIIASISYQEVNYNKNLTPIVDESGNLIGWEGIENSFTFNDCQIFSENTGKSLVSAANEYTTIEFNNCKIIGSVSPSRGGFDKTEPKYYFNYVDGVKTYHSGAGCSCKPFSDEDGDGVCTCGKSKTMVLAIGGPKTGTVVFGNGTTYLKSATLDYVSFEAGRATSEGKITIVFADSAYGTKEAEGTIVEIGGEVTNPTITVVIGDKISNYEDLIEAINDAPAGATIYIHEELDPITLNSSIIIDKKLTIDLGGTHLQIIQNASKAQIFIRTSDEVVFQNGRISAASSADYGARTKDYDNGDALFVADTVKVNLALNNVSTYTAAIFANTVSGSVLNVTGGYHNGTTLIKTAVGSTDRGLVLTTKGMTATFTGASFYIDYCSALLGSTSTENATFTYTDCKVHLNDGSHRFIRVANDKTFVYFNNSDVFGAFAIPSNKTGGKFTSANLHFDENCTWGHPSLGDSVNLVMPTLPAGYAFTLASGKVEYSVHAVSGKFYANSFKFATGETSSSFNVNYRIVQCDKPRFSVNHSGGAFNCDNTFTLDKAVVIAPKGATVKLLDNYTIETATYVATIDKQLTLDLGGYTITVIQEHQNAYFNIKATSTVTIKNGTIIVGANNSYENIKKGHNYAAPAFRTNVATDLVFNDITFYGSTVVYNYGERAATVKVSFNNFTYYGMFNQVDATYPSLVDSRGNIAVTVTNSYLYLDKAVLLSSLNNKFNGTDNSQKKSTFDFTDTKIYSVDPSKSLFANANDKTFVTFTNCDIIGKFSPALNNWDKNAGDNKNGVASAAMPASNITFNAGCRWGFTGTSDLIPTVGTDVKAVIVDKVTQSYTYAPSTGCFLEYQEGEFGEETDKFTILAPADFSATYTIVFVGTSVEDADYNFVSQASNGIVYYGNDLELFIATITEGSTITLLKDVKITTDRYLPKDKKDVPTNYEATYIVINKALTIDLGGKTLTIEMRAKNGGFSIKTTDTVTFKNGNMVAIAHEDYLDANGNSGTATYALVSVMTDNANVVFNGVNTMGGSLIYSWGNKYTVTVNGGTHVLTGARDMNTGGFIAGQANFTATVNNATIYVNVDYVVGASSYKELDRYNGQTITAEEVFKKINTTVTFNGCNIIGSSASKNIVGNANQFTHINFNNCNIIGSITPTLNGSDTNYSEIDGKFYFPRAACTCSNFYDKDDNGKCDNPLECTKCKLDFDEGEAGVEGKCGNFICTKCNKGFVDDDGDEKCDTCKGTAKTLCGAEVVICGKYDPTTLIAIKGFNKDNIVLGAGTYFSSKSNILSNTTFADEYIRNKTVSYRVNIEGAYYTFDSLADYIKVTWYDEKGDEIKTVNIDANFTSVSKLTPEYEGVGGITNGWYKIGGYIANSWTLILGGTDAADLNSLDLTNDIALYPQASSDNITAYLTEVMYNLSITGAIRNNFYIPTTPENVEILGVYVGDKEIKGTPVLYRDHDGDPIYYIMYVLGEVGATEFTKSTEVRVKYMVNGEIELEQRYTISPEKYANAIYNDSLKTEGNKYNTKAYNVVADLVRYSYLLSVYASAEGASVNEADLAAITALYNKMSALCSELPSDNAMAGSNTNASNLAGVGQIQYEASSYEPRWKFTLNASAQIVDIKITLDGYNNGFLNDRTNFGTQTYGIEQITRDADGCITVAYTQNIPVYNIVQAFTITFTKADGSEISGTYDLKSYYSAVLKNTSAADFVKSVVALAGSTVAYKFPEGKITTNDLADFWECDHANAEKQPEIAEDIYVFKPHYCSSCDSYLFYYEDYGAVADGKTNRTRATHVSGTNDYEAIYWTHRNANQWKERTDLSGGKHVAVIGNSNPSEAKFYYISLPEGRGVYKTAAYPNGYKIGQNLGSITIATDTSWNGVNWIIDDDTLCNSSGCSCVNEAGVERKHAYNSQAIFTLDEYGTEKVEADFTGKINTLKPGDDHIGFAPGRKMLVHIANKDHKIWYRYGSNAQTGYSEEVILVDEFGNIDPSTPVQWTYTKFTSVTAYAVDTEEIKISGLNSEGKINSSYESYVNNSLSITIPHYETCGRDITINRSNATIEGIDRFFTEEPAKGYATGNRRFAYNFISVHYCSNATVKDMKVLNHNGQSGASGTSQGSYEFNGGNANATSWINCITKNMFSDPSDGSVIAYPKYRGLFGTNGMRNMYLKDCKLNSFDAHTGAYNVTIVDSTFEHMNFVGGGQITLKGVTIYTSKNYGSALNLRTDYGAIWKGDLDIDDLEIRYSSEEDYKPARITLLYGGYKNFYYGFEDGIYMPQNVKINNFHIQAYTATVSNGVRTETLGAKDATDIKVYYYYAIDSLSADSVGPTTTPGADLPSKTDENGTTLDYGSTVLHCTKNLTITNSVTLTLPTGTFWQNMNVTIDGTQYKATKKYNVSLSGIKYYLEWSKQ